jgi:thiol-disulfide isomerase/thioredoxin
LELDMTDPANTDPSLSPNAAVRAKPDIARIATRAAGWLALAGAIGFGFIACQAGQPGPIAAQTDSLKQGAMAKFSTEFAGRAAPGAMFFAPDGEKTATLTGAGAKVTVVNLWATWCPPCVKEMPTLAALQTTFAGQGVKVMALSVDRAEDRKFAGEELARLSGGVLSLYADPSYGVVYAIGDVKGFPTTIVYDSAGKEIGRIHETDWSAPEARALIEAALRGESIR